MLMAFPTSSYLTLTTPKGTVGSLRGIMVLKLICDRTKVLVLISPNPKLVPLFLSSTAPSQPFRYPLYRKKRWCWLEV